MLNTTPKLRNCTLILCGCLLLLSIINPLSSYANIDDKTLENAFVRMSTLADISKDVLEKSKINTFKELAQNLLDTGVVPINASGATLDYNQSKVLEINDQNEAYTSITVPIVSDKYSLISNLTLLFNSKNELITYTETLLTNSKDKFKIDIYVKNELISSQNTSIDFVSNSEIQKGIDEFHQYAEKIKTASSERSVGKIAACIAAIAGINAGVAYLIAGTCVASCPAVVPICAACIAGVATLGAADVAGVVACFK